MAIRWDKQWVPMDGKRKYNVTIGSRHLKIVSFLLLWRPSRTFVPNGLVTRLEEKILVMDKILLALNHCDLGVMCLFNLSWHHNTILTDTKISWWHSMVLVLWRNGPQLRSVNQPIPFWEKFSNLYQNITFSCLLTNNFPSIILSNKDIFTEEKKDASFRNFLNKLLKRAKHL